jgi:hypothetical protein
MNEEQSARMSAVLGATGVVLGNIQGHGDLEIRGRVQGDIVLDGRVLVAASGLVLGRLTSPSAAPFAETSLPRTAWKSVAAGRSKAMCLRPALVSRRARE